MHFVSILFEDSASSAATVRNEAPDYFVDLNLDQTVESILIGRDEYTLAPFFFTPLSRIETIEYRQEVMRDLEKADLSRHIGAFARAMRTMRALLDQAGKRYHPYLKQREFLNAVDAYCNAIHSLGDALTGSDLASRGFLAFRDYLTVYRHSAQFMQLSTETATLLTELAGVGYRLDIVGTRIKVSRATGQSDYSAEVLGAFEKFREGTPNDHRFNLPSGSALNPVEAVIIDLVAKLYPEQFALLREYCAHHEQYLDATIRVFDREVQFYLSFLEHIGRHRRTGLPFCYPTITTHSKEIYGCETFDLALAQKLDRDKMAPVSNDFCLKGPERILIVSGANQGGKTTFARTFGQMHHLASLGCPVPGKAARLFLFDQLFTHFEREEELKYFNSKLESDLLGIRAILASATARSIIIMNESFSSTTLEDALLLSREVLRQIIERDILCVSVTFFDELASLGESTVSMVGTVDVEVPTQRTFKIIRRPADGLAYAVAIAEKYRLTYPRLKERLAKTRS
jgi:hypothetical protein